MKKRSFATRLSRKIIIITSIIFVLALGIISACCARMILNSSRQYTAQALEATADEIQISLRSTEKAAEAVASTISSFYCAGSQVDKDSFFTMITDALEANPDFKGMGIYYEPYKYTKESRFAGIYASRDSETNEIVFEWDDDVTYLIDEWDYFEQDWYTAVQSTLKPAWISPFLENMWTYYTLLTTYSCPVLDSEGNLVAVFAIDLSLDWIKDKLISLRPYEHSNLVLADADLNYICNPESETPYEGSHTDNQFISDHRDQLAGVTKDSWITIEDRKDGFYVASRMSNDWILCAYNLYDDAFKALYIFLAVLSAILILGVLFLYFSSHRVIKRKTKPIVQFATAASQITDGHFDVPIPEVKTGDEIEDLGQALDFMQKSVTDFIDMLKITTAQKERLEGELNVAKNIQMEMLNNDFPKMDSMGICATSTPAREVGGDLYDFYYDGDNLLFVLGDVSGKGVPAAMLMSITISAFRAVRTDRTSMAEIMSLINKTFCLSSREMMFVTMVIGKINIKTGETVFCNGGHNPMVYIDPDGKSQFLALDKNLPVGVLDDFQYTENVFHMAKGSRLLVYTDGITEAEDADKNLYGDDRLLAFASVHSQAISNYEFIHDLMTDVEAFTKGTEPNDDRTALSITR